jgi:hypothetical protein
MAVSEGSGEAEAERLGDLWREPSEPRPSAAAAAEPRMPASACDTADRTLTLAAKALMLTLVPMLMSSVCRPGRARSCVGKEGP